MRTESVARVFGYCAGVACRSLDPDNKPYAYTHASDHCPAVMDLIDVDRD